jgi:hypothetical protein
MGDDPHHPLGGFGNESCAVQAEYKKKTACLSHQASPRPQCGAFKAAKRRNKKAQGRAPSAALGNGVKYNPFKPCKGATTHATVNSIAASQHSREVVWGNRVSDGGMLSRPYRASEEINECPLPRAALRSALGCILSPLRGFGNASGAAKRRGLHGFSQSQHRWRRFRLAALLAIRLF